MKTTLLDHLNLGPYKESVTSVQLDAPSALPAAHMLLVGYHKVREYFVYRDDHGLGSMAIHLANHCFSFNIQWIRNLTTSRDSAHQITQLTEKA